jgi:hypothetical protein
VVKVLENRTGNTYPDMPWEPRRRSPLSLISTTTDRRSNPFRRPLFPERSSIEGGCFRRIVLRERTQDGIVSISHCERNTLSSLWEIIQKHMLYMPLYILAINFVQYVAYRQYMILNSLSSISSTILFLCLFYALLLPVRLPCVPAAQTLYFSPFHY